MNNLPDPVTLIFIGAIVGIAPATIIMATSFVKLVIVLSLIRNALGVQQIPPNMVLHALAIVLTVYIMAPVFVAGFEILETVDFTDADVSTLMSGLNAASGPFRDFLSKNAMVSETSFFMQTAGRLWPVEMRDSITADNLLILIPAFTVSELTRAFEIGFLIYLPFIIIDLIISNVLLAMGMMMVSPMTISLPFKLLLFVMIDGWTKLVHGLVLTY